MGGATPPGPESGQITLPDNSTLSRGGNDTPGPHGASNGVQQQLTLVGFPRTLTWSDFREIAQRPSGVAEDAEIATDTRPSEMQTVQDGNQWKIASVELRIVPNRESSWVVRSRKSAALLAHEQGHFDIHGIIVGRDLMASFRRLRARNNERLTRKVRRTMRRAQSNAQQMTNDYDSDTNHGLDTAQQTAWERQIQNAITNNTRLSAP